MIIKKYSYRKNFFLNTLFVVLMAFSLFAALFIAHNLSVKYVRNEFDSQKIDVLEETVKPYNEFFQNKIPEISFYQGYLDSASAAKYADTAMGKYPFINSIVFYDAEISNHPGQNVFRVNNLFISPKAVYQFRNNKQHRGTVTIFKRSTDKRVSIRYMEEFNKVSENFAGFIESADTTKTMLSEESFGAFYTITQNRISFMNIPREEELRVFKGLMNKKLNRSPIYEQDIFSFRLNPFALIIRNSNPGLYQSISIKPVVYESMTSTPEYITTELPLYGPFSDYKLYLKSTHEHLSAEVNRRFLPTALTILVIYLALIFIGYLIYRNLYINNRLFKLQYDFVNNLTHEFKTPVSVIKIAGNNIRSSAQLSERELKHYGKILDEEADKLNDMMNKLLSFTQIENHSIRVRSEKVNLEIFIQNMVDGYQLKYPDFDISYVTEVTYFHTDPVLLSSIFHNLADNAYKYSMPKRKVLHIEVYRERANIVFRFADQGIGIPKEEMDNIFQKFYRIQNRYNQQGSVGIGLAFCKELINYMKGRISVKSKVGLGSDFIVLLPYND